MADKKTRYERQRKIHQELSSSLGKGVSLKRLVQICGGVSENTIYAEIDALKAEDAPIENSRKMGGYYYTKPYALPAIENLPLQERDLQQLTMVGEILNQFEGLTLFQEFRGVIQKISNAIKYKIFKNQTKYSNQTNVPSEPIIHFESVPYSKGSEFIATFYDATEKQHEVTFLYQKFDGAEIKKHTIQPHWLKEHKNRWYVIGINVKYGDFNAFGLDRVQAPPSTGGYFRRNATTLQELTKHSYGLRIPTRKDRVEKVVLCMTPKRGRYFKAQPLFKYHKTRDVLVDNDQEFRVQTQLIINEEFEMELAKLGDSVTVIAPVSLRKNVMNYHKAAAENYGLEWCELDKEE